MIAVVAYNSSRFENYSDNPIECHHLFVSAHKTVKILKRQRTHGLNRPAISITIAEATLFFLLEQKNLRDWSLSRTAEYYIKLGMQKAEDSVNE